MMFDPVAKLYSYNNDQKAITVSELFRTVSELSGGFFSMNFTSFLLPYYVSCNVKIIKDITNHQKM